MRTTTVRLVVIRAGLGASDALAAINLDTQEQCFIAEYSEAYEFICDVIGLDDGLAGRYGAGRAIAVGMDSTDWSLWLEACPVPEAISDVWLTVSPESEQGDAALSAMDHITKREVIALREKAAFVADVQGWNESAYQKNRSFVCRMSAENWAAWLEVWEVATLPKEIVQQLSA